MSGDKYIELFPEDPDENFGNFNSGIDPVDDDNSFIVPPENMQNGSENKGHIIRVIGVGGGGGNAVQNMYREGIKDVDFIICNTDEQVLKDSPIPKKIQIGKKLTKGLGAGNDPKIGREAAKESIEEIKEALEGAQMIFVTAGMGGGTGTGAAPVVSQLAREMEILTVGIVTLPFRFEGPDRIKQAIEGISELRKSVDALLLIDNERIMDVYNSLSVKEAFLHVDEVLTVAAKGIAEIITYRGDVNVDFADVRNVLKDSGLAIMGTGYGTGENRAREAVQEALFSPLLHFIDVKGAKRVLFNLVSSNEKPATTSELEEISKYITNETQVKSNIIWGTTENNELGDKLSITVIATGFDTDIDEYLAQLAAELSEDETPKQEERQKDTVAKEEAVDTKAKSAAVEHEEKEKVQEEKLQKQSTKSSHDSYYKSNQYDDLQTIVQQLPPRPIRLDANRPLKYFEETPAFMRFGMSIKTENDKKGGKGLKKIIVVGTYEKA